MMNPSSGAYDNGPLMVNAATADVNIGEVVEDVIIDDNSPAVNTRMVVYLPLMTIQLLIL